jgi:DNA sulfur modification protein DndD
VKIKRIAMKNFKQFYGEQEIAFSTDQNNITIVIGLNGSGKTSIFRALIFGLYGERYLSQDDKSVEINLVNLKYIQENPGMLLNAKVSIEFEHEGETFKIIRSISANDSGREKINDAYLYVTDEFGNFNPKPIKEKNEIRRKVNNMLDIDIKDFFLFDGEKIEILARAKTDMKKEVKKAIVKLLHIQTLDRAISILRNLYNKERQKITEKSTDINLRKTENEINEIKDRIKQFEEKIEIKNEELEKAIDEANQIESELEENEKILSYHKELRELKKNKDEIFKQFELKKEKLSENYYPLILGLLQEVSFIPTRDYLQLLSTRQNDHISLDVLDRIINKKTCICGNDLTENEMAMNQIKLLKGNYQKTALSPFLTIMRNEIDSFLSSKEEKKESLKEWLSYLREDKDKIDGINIEIEELKNRISEEATTEKHLENLEHQLEGVRYDLERIKIEIQENEIRKKDGIKKLEEEEAEYSIYLEKNETLKIEKIYLGKIKSLYDGLVDSYEEHSRKMREKLMNEATNIFKEIISIKDKNTIKKISINEKYEIESISWQGSKIIQDISQGQRQIVSISFITALAKIAAGSTERINFPLFMDTPFAKIDSENRKGLIENIHKLTTQWILLLTDTEFTQTEEEEFRKTKKIGAWYDLVKVEDGYTKISEIQY